MHIMLILVLLSNNSRNTKIKQRTQSTLPPFKLPRAEIIAKTIPGIKNLKAYI